MTRRSISGLFGFVGCTMVTSSASRQGAINTSTYSAELCAAKSGAEEAVSLRYMLRSIGVEPDGPTLLIGDNLGSLRSTTNPGAECKKRHVNIAFHYVRECNAAGIVRIYKVHTDYNPSDMNTKALDKDKIRSFSKYVGYLEPTSRAAQV